MAVVSSRHWDTPNYQTMYFPEDTCISSFMSELICPGIAATDCLYCQVIDDKDIILRRNNLIEKPQSSSEHGLLAQSSALAASVFRRAKESDNLTQNMQLSVVPQHHKTTTMSALSKSTSSNLSLRTNTDMMRESKRIEICCRNSNSDTNYVASESNMKATTDNFHIDVRYTSSFSSVIAFVFLIVFLANIPSTSLGEPIKVSIHAIIPRHFAMYNDMSREFTAAVLTFKRDSRNSRIRNVFNTKEEITFIDDDTPREILDAFCKGVLSKRTITILNINNPLGIRRRTSSNKYILELANYLGIPVISWDSQFSGSGQVGFTNLWFTASVFSFTPAVLSYLSILFC